MRHPPGLIRDAIVSSLNDRGSASVADIGDDVRRSVGDGVPASSIRSYLQLNTPGVFERTARGRYTLAGFEAVPPSGSSPTAASWQHGNCALHLADCNAWLEAREAHSIQAVVTDPPYGLVEYSDVELAKLRAGRGGVWRIPPGFDGANRAPLPRFTTLTAQDLEGLDSFFFRWAKRLVRVLVPGANVVVASNPLLSYLVSGALVRAGLERRGEIARLVMTMRGGDRPKAAHVEFEGVSVMPRSMWEPWLVFRRPLEGRVQDNLRKWGTGGFRRLSATKPFGDVIASAPTRAAERRLAPHPSLKPQAFLRQIVRAALPLGRGVVLDPFAGSGSTLAAAEAVSYESIGVERDRAYFDLAAEAVPRLAALRVEAPAGASR